MTEEMDYGTRVLCPEDNGFGTVLYETLPRVTIEYKDGRPIEIRTPKYMVRLDAGGEDGFVGESLYVVEPGWSMS